MSALDLRLRVPLGGFTVAAKLSTSGRVTGIFGPSGAGKTTLLRSLAGLERRAEGRISFRGETWLDSKQGIRLAPERRGVGYVPQHAHLFPHLDVRGNLLAGVPRWRRKQPAHRERLARTCSILELDPLLARRVDRLSGGERRRVALGRALCAEPRLLLLDEPLASLDVALRRRLLPTLRRVREELDVPMIVVTHDPVEVQMLCDELLVLERGRQVGFGDAQLLLLDPAVLERSSELGWETVFPARVVSSGRRTGRVLLGGYDELAITTPPLASAPRDEVAIGLRSHEILLATERPVGLSARNIVRGEVMEVRRRPDLEAVVVRLHPDLPSLVVDVTEAAREDLELAPGREVWVIAKTAGVELYEPLELGTGTQ